MSRHVQSLVAARAARAAVARAGQDALSLGDAIARALAGHPSVAAVVAARQEAEARVDQARAGWLPRVDVSEAGSAATSRSSSSGPC